MVRTEKQIKKVQEIIRLRTWSQRQHFLDVPTYGKPVYLQHWTPQEEYGRTPFTTFSNSIMLSYATIFYNGGVQTLSFNQL